MQFTDEQVRQFDFLESIFFAQTRDRQEQLEARKLRLAHYTTAENAVNIIRNKTMWLRDTQCMSDYSEVMHGYTQLLEYFDTEGKRDKFIKALNQCAPACGEMALQRFDDWWAHIRTESYVCCLSEHEAGKEDSLGRLSMWRAYGANFGVAIILRPPRPYSAVPLNVMLSPVEYFSKESSWRLLDHLIDRVERNQIELKKLPPELLTLSAYRMLVIAALSLKHPAFEEEREWRLIHLPFENPSIFVKQEIVSIKGVPQKIYKIPLENYPSDGISGVSIPDLLDRIIIGPAQFVGPIFSSLIEVLLEVGVEEPHKKIIFSQIPLRT